MDLKDKIVFITGATSGIGESTARILAEHGCRLIICGRREERLAQLAKELSPKTEVQTLSFDVRSRQETEAAITNLPMSWKNIDILINNAGNAHGLAPIQSGNVDDWDAMIDINVKGLLYVSKCIIPGMVDRRRGHIINIGSIAGLETYPNGNVYCGSKSAVQAITKGMRMDLNPYGIKVTAIHPGLVETEFSLVRFKGDEEKAATVYAGLKPLVGDDIANIIHFTLSQPDHVVLADMTVFPTAQASSTVVHRAKD